MKKGMLGAILVTALLVLYTWAVGGRAVALVRTGDPVAVAIGASVVLIPLVAIWVLVQEYRLAVTVQRMSNELDARGELDVDDLPRSPGGRVDRAAADAQFGPRREAVEQDPEDWANWFRLGFAYDAAGDRRRARSSLRTAAGIYRSRRSGTAGTSAP
ncbi:tetratricopeptide repeat protein [Paraoerskovia marina]|uniref:Tetratricopeptide repeat-containing protein n=1 Tax=Paraoerskovia marina TaxID=545619 RepID=A0A1H1TX81_9CELL|nr:tetratricopeptide repeat protein [Paraoerskovia marina]SDS64847.1 hypothetical protein SAMN04489860_2027 [Paraoerskovia marina]